MPLISELCDAATYGGLETSQHYRAKSNLPTIPESPEILFALCQDAPEIIEDYPDDPRGGSCLIWGTTADGAVVHLVCGYQHGYTLITAYFPETTAPGKWSSNFRIRRPRQTETR